MGYHVNAPEFGRVLKGERQGAERDMAKESSESGARPPSPLQNGFGVLDMLDGKTMAEVEAEREAERKRDQELNAKLREIRREHEREMDEERTRALTKSMDDLKISSSELEKRNQKFASGTVVYKKPSIEDEVLGGAAATTGKKGKRNRVRKEGPVNLTKDVLPKRTVDLRALRKHNNAVFAKEKAERDARREPGRSASQSQRQRHRLWRRLLWRHHQNRPRSIGVRIVSVGCRMKRLNTSDLLRVRGLRLRNRNRKIQLTSSWMWH